jgi:hypothetical protein
MPLLSFPDVEFFFIRVDADGIRTLRAFKSQQYFADINSKRIQASQKPFCPSFYFYFRLLSSLMTHIH